MGPRSTTNAWREIHLGILGTWGCGTGVGVRVRRRRRRYGSHVSPAQEAACATLAAAECARKQACFSPTRAGWLEDCTKLAARECETVFLLDGVTQTSERVLACAGSMPSAACGPYDNFVGGAECEPPPGALSDNACELGSYAGGLPEGSVCGSETGKLPLGCAAGLFCQGPEDGLGKCVLDRGPGQSCQLKNVFSVDPCENGLKCISGTCRRELHPTCN